MRLLCTRYEVRRRRLARLCMMYDVRCTIWEVSALCAGILRSRRRRDALEPWSGAEADGVCPCTKYEVRCTIWEVSALCAGRWRLTPPMYDVRLQNSRAGRGIVVDGMAKKSRRWGQHRREKNESWGCCQILPKRDLPSERRSDVATLRRSQMPCSPFLR